MENILSIYFYLQQNTTMTPEAAATLILAGVIESTCPTPEAVLFENIQTLPETLAKAFVRANAADDWKPLMGP